MDEERIDSPVPDKSAQRFVFVDGLRGLAASMVVFTHFTVAGADATDPFVKAFSPAVVQLLGNGKLGVEIFFVISGFVIAYSQRGTTVTPRYFFNFALRRSFRLDPPYWVTIFLETIILFAAGHAMHARAHIVPTPKQILSHLVYLQDLLRYNDIVPVFWTLCLEVQFYIFYTLFRGIGQLAPAGRARGLVEGVIMAGLAVYSLGIFCGWISDPLIGLFIKYWFMFFLGVTVWWVIDNPNRKPYFFGLVLLGSAALVFRYNNPVLIVLLTATAIFLAAKTNRMGRWLSNPVIQFLGKISYSLYLIHVVIGTRVIGMGTRFTGDTIVTKLLWIAVALIVSIAAATLMYRWIERPSMQLAKRLRGSNWKRKSEPGYLTTQP